MYRWSVRQESEITKLLGISWNNDQLFKFINWFLVLFYGHIKVESDCYIRESNMKFQRFAWISTHKHTKWDFKEISLNLYFKEKEIKKETYLKCPVCCVCFAINFIGYAWSTSQFGFKCCHSIAASSHCSRIIIFFKKN